MNVLVLAFADCLSAANQLAARLDVPCQQIQCHTFPDGESKITLPTPLPDTVVLYRSLDDPNRKLIEVLLAAQATRDLGARQLILVCPYLCYMRQDKAFHSGEAVSQQIIGRFLAQLFDGVITVDAHLHRIQSLQEAIPLAQAVNLYAAELLGGFLTQHGADVMLLGPDQESQQWVARIAQQGGFNFAVADKTRQDDQHVRIKLPPQDYRHKHMVLVDDMISSGHTLAETARQLYAAGAQRVDALCTHALYDAQAAHVLSNAGIRSVWSSNSVSHPTNVIELAPLLAGSLHRLLES